MEETVYTPFEFFNLPYYLQRKIMIEELDFESVQKLCDVAAENKGIKEFFEGLCGSVEVWKDKFRYDFPRSFDIVQRWGIERGHSELVSYWKYQYRFFREVMPTWENNLIEASKNCDTQRAEYLLDLGVDPNITSLDEYGERTVTPLINAATYRYDGIVRALLKAGAEANFQDEDWWTALTYALEFGDIVTPDSEDGDDLSPHVVSMLVDAGADVNVRDRSGSTPLTRAYNVESAKILLEAGADPNAEDRWMNTVLMDHSRHRYSNTEVLQELINAGADVNWQNKKGLTAVMWSALAGHDANLRTLLNAGADVDIQDEEGNTALMLALNPYNDSGSKLDAVFEIIHYKPDPDIPNNEGETAVDIAERLGLDSVVDALLYLRRQKTAL